MVALTALVAGVVVLALSIAVGGLGLKSLTAWHALGALLIADGVIRVAIISADTGDEA
ncbi:MAG: hypothetical protein U0531_21290 [Dehalococcoidia bacterium]